MDEKRAALLPRVDVPVKGGPPVVLDGEFPITEDNWNKIMTALAAMKPLRARDPDEDEDDAS